MNKLQESMKREATRLEQSIKEKEQQLAGLPEGELKCYYFNDTFRWFVINKDEKARRKRSYLSKSQYETAQDLALKGWISRELQDEKKELNAIQMYLRHSCNFNRGKDFINNEENQRLLSDYFHKEQEKQSAKINDWLSQRSTRSAPYPEMLKVRTRAGFNVRSKSERDIIHTLMKFNLPFKYENCIETDIGPLFPDITILNPTTYEETIWEHNGSMDNPEYAEKVMRRTAAYYRLGYHPDKNFIMTFEENNEGIDTDWVEAIIKQHFVSPYSGNVTIAPTTSISST